MIAELIKYRSRLQRESELVRTYKLLVFEHRRVLDASQAVLTDYVGPL